jgi:hypothetical protein
VSGGNKAVNPLNIRTNTYVSGGTKNGSEEISEENGKKGRKEKRQKVSKESRKEGCEKNPDITTDNGKRTCSDEIIIKRIFRKSSQKARDLIESRPGYLRG